MKLALPFSLLLLAATASGSATAQDSWTTPQVALEAADLGVIFVDYHQTQKIREFPGLYETNPLLGSHPSEPKVKNYFALSIIGQYFLADALSPSVRTGFLSGILGMEIIVTEKNKRLEHQHPAATGAVQQPGSGRQITLQISRAF